MTIKIFLLLFLNVTSVGEESEYIFIVRCVAGCCITRRVGFIFKVTDSVRIRVISTSVLVTLGIVRSSGFIHSYALWIGRRDGQYCYYFECKSEVKVMSKFNGCFCPQVVNNTRKSSVNDGWREGNY